MYAVNSCRHPRHPGADGHEGFVCMCTGGFVFVRTTEKQQQFHQQRSERERTIVPLTAFVCGGGDTGNEIMLRARAVCAAELIEEQGQARRRIPITY